MNSEAGVTLFQKDDHFLNAVVKRQETGYELTIALPIAARRQCLPQRLFPNTQVLLSGSWRARGNTTRYGIGLRPKVMVTATCNAIKSAIVNTTRGRMLAFTHRVMELRLQTTWTLTGRTTEPNQGNRTPFF